MAISEEMKQELESIVENAEQIKAMLKEQDKVDSEIGDYDEPVTEILGHLNVLQGIQKYIRTEIPGIYGAPNYRNTRNAY